MPTYQYACTACHDQFEVVQKFTDDALTECPHCGGKLRKVFSAVGVVFKGSGFYRTDNRGGSSGGGSSAGASSSKDSGSSAKDSGSSTKDSGSSGSSSSSSSSSTSTGSSSTGSSTS